MSFRPPVRDDLAELPGYHSPQLDVEHRLNTNESPEPPPPGFQQAVAERVAALDWHRYPDRGVTELRTKLAAHHAVAHPAITADNIFVANGSNEVLQTIMLAWGGTGRSILTFEPTYAMHGQIARVTGTPALVQRVLDAVSDFGLLVVDEAYAQFSDWSALDLFDEDKPMIVTRTFSKTWAMAAARLGYLIAPTWIIERLNTAILPYHLDAVSQAAGSAALDFEDEMNARVARMVEQRGAIQAGLAGLGVEFWPSHSNFILFRPDDGQGTNVWQQLVDRGVLVRNCASWPRLEGCLRVTVGTSAENVAFLDALAAILA